MYRRARVFAGAFGLLLAHVARGDGQQEIPAAPVAAYPVAVRLVLTPATVSERHLVTGVLGLPPTVGSPVVPVGEQAHDAYTTAITRMFRRPAEATRTAEVSPSMAAAGVDLDRDGWFAFVEHDVLLRDAAGAEVARWRVRGQGRILGVGASAIPKAFAEAADIAARTFETDFERPAGVRGWLTDQGTAPGARASAIPELPRRFTPASPPVVASRSSELMFAELGGGAIGGGGWMSTMLTARAGWSGDPWLVQLAIDVWPRQFVARPVTAWGEGQGRATLLSTGLDVGIQRRFTSRFEIAGGIGGALCTGFGSARYNPLATPTQTIDASERAFGLATSLFAAMRLNGITPGFSFRYRLGLEVRKSFATRLSFGSFEESVGGSGFSATAVLGFELPWQGVPGK